MKTYASAAHYTNTELLCFALGWQGGTVHQVSAETGLTVPQIVDTNRSAADLDRDGSGWFAVRTCGLAYNRETIFPKHQADLSFWMSAARGVQLALALGERIYPDTRLPE